MTEEELRQALKERGLLPDPDSQRGPKTVQALLQTHLGKLGLNEQATERQIVDDWEEVVGVSNAALTRPVNLRKGELVVAVSQPALKYTLERFHAATILSRLQERFGPSTVRSLRFRTGN